LADALQQALGKRDTLQCFDQVDAFFQFIEQTKEQVDCILLQDHDDITTVLKQLSQRSALLPIVMLSDRDHDIVLQEIEAMADSSSQSKVALRWPYHQAIILLDQERIPQLETFIEQAIAQFLKLSIQIVNEEQAKDAATLVSEATPLLSQQRRLSEKLKERLGYLGVYYKRNPANFLRHMTQSQRQQLLKQLKAEYREIILKYFSNDTLLNEKLDNFVNLAFFSDVSVSQIVEIHMELMDEFSKQLKLEGRNDDILQDYRLTLIDAIAHLCEMYRRSVPRES
jgi:circadian clock protein KaiA